MKYWVSIPITGSVGFAVEADDKKSAKEAAWKAVNDGQEGEVEWEYTEQVCRGNVFSGMQNEIEVSEQ
jgi:hypothetical protein